jgi:hypothetical protein
MGAHLSEYLNCLTQEERNSLPALTAQARNGSFGVFNEWRTNGYLRSYSVGLTTYKVPEIVIYGLLENEVGAFFDTYGAKPTISAP